MANKKTYRSQKAKKQYSAAEKRSWWNGVRFGRKGHAKRTNSRPPMQDGYAKLIRDMEDRKRDLLDPDDPFNLF